MKNNFKYRHQTGTTLIEIMVSIIVMAIGILGLASLQMNSLKFQKTASQRSEALQAAYDLGERMRANWPLSSSSNYTTEKATNEASYTYTTDYSTTVAASHVPPNASCNVALPAAGCTPVQIAQNDIQDWLRNLNKRLVGGAGYISPVAGTTNSSFDVIVMWKEQGYTAQDDNCKKADNSYVAPAGVRCFKITYTI
jgi:type IV pilus assembly protein PilV